MCNNEYDKEWRKKNKEYNSQYYQNNKEQRKEKKRLTDKKYHENNKEKILARNRTPLRRFNQARYDAKRRNIIFVISFEFWWAEVQKTCIYCQDRLGERSKTTVGLDRLDNNLGYIEENVASCCRFCNLTKCDRLDYKEMKIVAEALICHKISKEKV